MQYLDQNERNKLVMAALEMWEVCKVGGGASIFFRRVPMVF